MKLTKDSIELTVVQKNDGIRLFRLKICSLFLLGGGRPTLPEAGGLALAAPPRAKWRGTSCGRVKSEEFAVRPLRAEQGKDGVRMEAVPSQVMQKFLKNRYATSGGVASCHTIPPGKELQAIFPKGNQWIVQNPGGVRRAGLGLRGR